MRNFISIRPHCARKEVRGAARTEIPSQEKGYGGANAELKIGGIRMTIGQRIYQIRTEHGLSQEEFSAKLDTTRQTVSRWELDQTYPELAKIVLISKIFCVTTDSIIKDGISTFDSNIEFFTCGVYRSAHSKIVETEKFAMVYYCTPDKNILGTKLYSGYENRKHLVAICERNQQRHITEYAYSLPKVQTIISNSDTLASQLGETYDNSKKESMRRLEQFLVDHTGKPLPGVKDSGIPTCLALSPTYCHYNKCIYQKLSTHFTHYTFSLALKIPICRCFIIYPFFPKRK